ncbi:hypothetical protein ACET3Z_004304 [Daucus carota]
MGQCFKHHVIWAGATLESKPYRCSKCASQKGHESILCREVRSSVYSVICMVDAAYSVSKWGDMRGGICREVEAILHVLNLINSGALPDNKDSQNEEIEEAPIGKMTECNTDTPTEHVLPLEDAPIFKLNRFGL